MVDNPQECDTAHLDFISQHGLFLQMGPPEESWCRLDCEEDEGDEGDETIESRMGGEKVRKQKGRDEEINCCIIN
ncbi:unnamed protein product [Boreogadus saida]